MPYKNKKSEEYHKNYRKNNSLWIKEKQREHRKNNPWINSYCE